MSRRRTPRNYDGSQLTSHQLKDLLPSVLHTIGQKYEQRADLVMAAWPEVIGPQLAKMTEPLSFEEGVLLVRVRNSTLHSLLSRNEKPRLLQSLRDKFPHTPIKNILFRIG